MSERTEWDSRSEGAIDDLLTRFFQSEVPKPWPKLDRSRVTTPRSAILRGPRPSAMSSFATGIKRWQVAAAVLLLCFGYAMLSQSFPQQQAGGLSIGDAGTIGMGVERGESIDVQNWKSGVEDIKGRKIKISPLEVDPGRPRPLRFTIEDITPGKR